MRFEKNYRTKKEDDILFENTSKYRVKCKNCGHVMILAKYDKVICTYCGRYIFKTQEDEFKYRLWEQLMKVENGMVYTRKKQ